MVGGWEILSFRIVIVHQDHGDGNAEHNDATDNDLLAMVVVALDVGRILFVKFLESRAFGQFRGIDSANLLDFFLGHVQGIHPQAIALVGHIGCSGRECKGKKQKKNAKGTGYEV